MSGRHVDIGDTRLFVEERGDGVPLLVLHGGPGLDHRMFGDYLDSLADEIRLVFVDQRAQGQSDPAPDSTWSLEQHANDVHALAAALGLTKFAVLGHSYGAFVALQHAVDHPGDASLTIISSGLASTSRWLEPHLDAELEAFEPAGLRAQVIQSWEREKSAGSPEEVEMLWRDQLPFQFLDPYDPIIKEYQERTQGAVYSPDVLRFFANKGYGGIEVEDRLGTIPQPVLVLHGRDDRTCAVQAAEVMAGGIRDSEIVVFDDSAHMTFVEENEAYVEAVRDFVKRRFPR